ncbi:DoxX family membrane protein [Edaphobacter sp.]|uniref:DoxX family membrane protein n=1 Tax=Edaphobacter sp. TaxID=1934404 RepID=UPI002DBDA08C|nr:DoxX family membrane protein [Edaphobacter sp.]HEU5340749.1 DoxX family membrane protein [Edaphobacter sp.]
MKTAKGRVKTSWWALKIALGVMPIISGLDKFFNKLTDWGMYLGPDVTKVTHLSTPAFMHIVGVVEIVAGLIVLSRWTRIGGYIVMLWLIAIAVNLVTTGMFYDLAVRDIEIAVGAFVLTELSAAREENALAV